MRKQIDAFAAIDDKGEKRTIVHFADVPEFVEPQSEMKDEGYALDDDTPLRKIDETTFAAIGDDRRFRVIEDDGLAR